jgi:hypothetical protein
MAMRNKMDLSLGIAIGSSQQVALFVAPVLVFKYSYLRGADDAGVHHSEVVAVLAAVYLVAHISADGEQLAGRRAADQAVSSARDAVLLSAGALICQGRLRSSGKRR